MKDIEPNPKLNKVAAGLLVLLAGPPLYFGFNSLTFLPPDQWTWSVVPLAVGGVILACAAYLWGKPPMNAARITFRDGGFCLETRQVFRGEKAFDLDWSDITEITKTDGGLYGGRSMRVFYGADGQQALFSPSWTASDSIRIMERFKASAQAAGYALDKETGFWKGLVRDRWVVRKSA